MSSLHNLVVLDLASVGPAARASRILADFGMQVIKVAPVRAHSAKQTDPVFHAYGAGRGTQRLRVDLKSEHGRALLRRSVDRRSVRDGRRPGCPGRPRRAHQ